GAAGAGRRRADRRHQDVAGNVAAERRAKGGGVTDRHQRPASRDERAVADVRAPTHAERCRTLARGARSATLATVATDTTGFPYASLVTVAIDAQGRPLFLLSTLAEHTRNLLARPEASVL